MIQIKLVKKILILFTKSLIFTIFLGCGSSSSGDGDKNSGNSDNVWSNAIGYHIIIDRFSDGNTENNAAVSGADSDVNYKGGDLQGIIDKIDSDYFTDLGINCLIISSPVDSAESTGLRPDGHTASSFDGRWPSDLTAIENRFGNTADLQSLVTKAHAKNIRVIIEYIMNHISITSEIYVNHSDWFSPYQQLGTDIAWDSPDNIRGWITDYLADFNFTQTDARNYAITMAYNWITNIGIDGMCIMDSNLIDASLITYYQTQLSGLPQFRIYGDLYTNDQTVIESYLAADRYDGMMDYPLRTSVINTILLKNEGMNNLNSFLNANAGRYPGVMGTSLSGRFFGRAINFAQDTPLWNNVLDNGSANSWNDQPSQPAGQNAYERIAAAYTVLFTTPGCPVVFYGDEIGLAGGGDPDNMRMMPWSGYNTGQTFLFTRIKKLASIRSSFPALQTGTFNAISSTDDTLLYSMQKSGATIYVAINRADTMEVISGLPAVTLVNLIDNSSFTGPDISVPARTAMILCLQ